MPGTNVKIKIWNFFYEIVLKFQKDRQRRLYENQYSYEINAILKKNPGNIKEEFIVKYNSWGYLIYSGQNYKDSFGYYTVTRTGIYYNDKSLMEDVSKKFPETVFKNMQIYYELYLKNNDRR